MRKQLCNKRRQCGLDRMPPVIDTSSQYGSGGLNDQDPEYLIPLKSLQKTGSIRKKSRKPMTGGSKRVSSTKKPIKTTSKKKTLPKRKKITRKKQYDKK